MPPVASSSEASVSSVLNLLAVESRLKVWLPERLSR